MVSRESFCFFLVGGILWPPALTMVCGLIGCILPSCARPVRNAIPDTGDYGGSTAPSAIRDPMLIDSSDVPAVPLWINGHAFLAMAPDFHVVRCPSDGRILRRTPLCGTEVADAAASAAISAVDALRLLSRELRVQLMVRLADALVQYADHFGQLLAEESGLSAAASAAELSHATGLLRSVNGGVKSREGVVVLIVARAESPLAAPLRLAVDALMAGNTVLIKTDPGSPSVLVALAELSGRCGFPPGVINVVHGGDALLDRLRELADVRGEVG